MTHEDFKIQRDGLALQARLDQPDRAKSTLIILMHGFTADMGYTKDRIIPRLTQALLADGYPTLRFDFNGHGRSDGQLADMTVLNEIADGQAVLTYAMHQSYQRIVLLGHSQGGVVASMLAGYYPDKIGALILLAPAASLKTDAQKGVLQGSHYDPRHVPETLLIRGNLQIGGFYLRTAQTLPIYEVAQRYAGPVCLIHGTDDRIVDPGVSQHYQDLYKNSSLHLLAHADHSFLGGNADPAIQCVRDFLAGLDDRSH